MTPLTQSYWPATHELPLVNTTCGGVLHAAAAAHPTRVALVAARPDPTQRRRWTYAQLRQEAERTAHALLAHFKPGEHVAVWGGNSPEWVILQFGLALAGLVMVTVNPAYQARELAYVLRQARVRGVFYQARYRDLALRPVLEEAIAAESLALRAIECLDELAQFTAAACRSGPPRPGSGLASDQRPASLHDSIHLGHHRAAQRGVAQSLQRDQQRAPDGADQRP